MRRLIVLLAALAATPLAQAQAWIPALNHTCPSKTVVKVTAKAGGPVFINGKQATVKKFSATYFEASSAALHFSASVMTEAGGAPSVSYTGPGKLNGICAPIKVAAAAPAAANDGLSAARSACRAALAKTAGKPASAVTVTYSSESQAGVVIDLKLAGAAAPWRCVTDRNGKSPNVMFTGDEGKL